MNDHSAESDVPPPKWSDLFGIDPDFTGGMCSVCYVRWQRGAEQPDEFEHAECYARVFPPAVPACTCNAGDAAEFAAQHATLCPRFAHPRVFPPDERKA